MNTPLQHLSFTKMHGLGNDFVVLDLRDAPDPDAGLCRFLADRRRGIGCDLILGVAPPHASGSTASYRIWTPSGLASRQCGNGARCIAAWAVRAGLVGDDSFALDSPSGTHMVERLGRDRFRVALGVPDFSPSALPLNGFEDAQDEYPLVLDGLPELHFAAVSIGNPHAVFEVEDVATVPVSTLGARIRDASCLPGSINIGFVQCLSPERLRLRVDEFGAGETLACGSGACAAAAALMRKGQINRRVVVSLAGGDLDINWPSPTAEITMAGPVAFVFDGTVSSSIVATQRGRVAGATPQSSAISDSGIRHG